MCIVFVGVALLAGWVVFKRPAFVQGWIDKLTGKKTTP
jgi:hypothetical protein